jgi:sugar-specific transcriptional regulator TrmB
MLSSEAEIQALINFGLTATQARVYLWLNILGKSKAKTITKSSGISRQDVYRVLAELFEIGLVEKTLSSPTEFNAISGTNCISLLLQQRKKETLQMRNAASKIIGALTKKTIEKSGDQTSQLILVPEGYSILFKAQDLIEQAQITICSISPSQNLFPWIDNESKSFGKALSRKVRIRVITDLNRNKNQMPPTLLALEKNPFFQIRYLKSPPNVSFGVYDDRKLILELSATSGFLGSQTIVTENPCLIDMATNYFKFKWNQAQEFKIEKKLFCRKREVAPATT